MQSPQFDVSFPEKLLKIVATKARFFSLKFVNPLPYEFEIKGRGVMSCDIIIGEGRLGSFWFEQSHVRDNL